MVEHVGVLHWADQPRPIGATRCSVRGMHDTPADPGGASFYEVDSGTWQAR